MPANTAVARKIAGSGCALALKDNEPSFWRWKTEDRAFRRRISDLFFDPSGAGKTPTVTMDGPKISSGGSLSPRGDWRAPSDGTATAWLEALKAVPDRL